MLRYTPEMLLFHWWKSSHLLKSFCLKNGIPDGFFLIFPIISLLTFKLTTNLNYTWGAARHSKYTQFEICFHISIVWNSQMEFNWKTNNYKNLLISSFSIPFSREIYEWIFNVPKCINIFIFNYILKLWKLHYNFPESCKATSK